MYIKNAILAEILEILISQKLNMYVVITASRSISNCTTTEWIVYQVEWLVLISVLDHDRQGALNTIIIWAQLNK